MTERGLALAYAALMGSMGVERYNRAQWVTLHQLAKSVVCPWCDARVHMTCVTPTGHALTVEPAHASRIAKAREHRADQAAAREESREQARPG